MIEPGKNTECGRLLEVMRHRRISTIKAAADLGITSFHRRLTDLRLMGWTINQVECEKLDERGKRVKHWNEYWVET